MKDCFLSNKALQVSEVKVDRWSYVNWVHHITTGPQLRQLQQLSWWKPDRVSYCFILTATHHSAALSYVLPVNFHYMWSAPGFDLRPDLIFISMLLGRMRLRWQTETLLTTVFDGLISRSFKCWRWIPSFSRCHTNTLCGSWAGNCLCLYEKH